VLRQVKSTFQIKFYLFYSMLIVHAENEFHSSSKFNVLHPSNNNVTEII